MAGATTTATMTDTVYAKVLEDSIQAELRPWNVIDDSGVVRQRSSEGMSKVYRFTLLTDPGLTDEQSITEGSTDLIGTLHDVNTSGADATAAQKGIVSLVTDLLKKVSILDAESQVTGSITRTMLEQYETDVIGTASPSGFTNITGDTTNPMSLSRLLAGLSALEQRDNGGPFVAVLHPKQGGEIRSDVASSGATFLAGTNAVGATSPLENNGQAYLGAPFGIDTYMTTVVPTSDTAAGRAGFIAAKGQALGVNTLWRERVELQRDASKVSDEVNVTSCYGAAVIDVLRAQLIKTKA